MSLDGSDKTPEPLPLPPRAPAAPDATAEVAPVAPVAPVAAVAAPGTDANATTPPPAPSPPTSPPPSASPTPPLWTPPPSVSPTPPLWMPSSQGASGAPPADPLVSSTRRGPLVKATAVLVAVALVAAGFGIGSSMADGDDRPDVVGADASVQPAALDADRPTEAPVSGDAEEPTAAVAEAVAPTVVQVQTNEGLGAGIIYDAEGLVLTNAHVVGDADEVQVILADGTRFEGEVLGADRARDVAVVSFDPGELELPVAVLATDEDVRVGQLAVAVGSPFGLEQTVTAGIVSAIARPIAGQTNELVVGMIQTDAPINAGNSGGALADRRGRIIGVNTSITSRSGDNTGIGFAIPISIAARVADSIVAGDVPAPTFLGVRGPEDGDGPVDGHAGALVDEVTPDSAADGKIQVGDVIVAIDGHAVRTFIAMAGLVGSYLPGDEVKLRVLRDEEPVDVTIVLGERPDALVS